MAKTALVLGGGGVTGIGWEIGMLAGFAQAGVDLSGADMLIGTSAGSVVATLVSTETPLEQLYAEQLADPTGEISARLGNRMLLSYGMAMLLTRDPRRYRARMGALALSTVTESEAERRKVISTRLTVRDWPKRPLQITAVDAQSGDFVVFDADSGVDLVDAVGASCAVPGVWPPVTINGRRHIDGGMRSAVNADLASGYDRIVVIAPLPSGFGPVPSAAKQVAALRAEGALVALFSPNDAARKAIGRNVLDPARRPAAARAGRAQALRQAAQAAEVWLG
jgi:NTE family protein